MKKNGLLQTFFYDFLKIKVTNYVCRNEKGYIGNTWRHVFFYQKGHGAQKKGHGAVPYYFSLDKTLIMYKCISQIVLKTFLKISLIIKESPEEIWIKLPIVLKISKSS
jgi:hypothetical protein